jgi:NADH dehydrogenase (ubiquinone) Fe-S protein 6
MLCSTRSRIPAIAARLTRTTYRSATTARQGTGENREQANDPTPPREPPNVSKTNETGVTTFGAQDGVLQESAAEGERQRQHQAPNRPNVWSRSQQPRERAMTGPRFEQTIIEYQVSRTGLQNINQCIYSSDRETSADELQPQPYAAIELIHKQPVRWTHDKVVACDGGGGPLGHPRIFINTDKPQVCMCTYCGLPFVSVQLPPALSCRGFHMADLVQTLTLTLLQANEHHRKYLESLPSTPYPLRSTADPAEVGEPQKVTDEPIAQR